MKHLPKETTSRRDFLELLPNELLIKILEYLELPDFLKLRLVSRKANELTSERVIYQQYWTPLAVTANDLLEQLHPAEFSVKNPQFVKNEYLRWHPAYQKLLSLAQQDDQEKSAFDLKDQALQHPMHARILCIYPELYTPIVRSTKNASFFTQIATHENREAAVLVLSTQSLYQIIFDSPMYEFYINQIVQHYSKDMVTCANDTGMPHTLHLAKNRIIMLTSLLSATLGLDREENNMQILQYSHIENSPFLSLFNRTCADANQQSLEQRENTLTTFAKKVSSSREGISFMVGLMYRRISFPPDRKERHVTGNVNLDVAYTLTFFMHLVKVYELHLLENWPFQHTSLSDNRDLLCWHLLIKLSGYPERPIIMQETAEPEVISRRRFSF
jgi:hypothetical protein